MYESLRVCLVAAAMDCEVEVHFTGLSVRLLVDGVAAGITSEQIGETVYDFDAGGFRARRALPRVQHGLEGLRCCRRSENSGIFRSGRSGFVYYAQLGSGLQFRVSLLIYVTNKQSLSQLVIQMIEHLIGQPHVSVALSGNTLLFAIRNMDVLDEQTTKRIIRKLLGPLFTCRC